MFDYQRVTHPIAVLAKKVSLLPARVEAYSVYSRRTVAFHLIPAIWWWSADAPGIHWSRIHRWLQGQQPAIAGGFNMFNPSKNMKVSWVYYSQSMKK